MRHRMVAALRIAASAAAAALLIPAAIEAVYVSPTAVFMDDRAPSAQVTIGNAGDSPEEATVEIRFGFPDADSAGTPFVRMIDDPDSTYPSAADWVRRFRSGCCSSPSRSRWCACWRGRPRACQPGSTGPG